MALSNARRAALEPPPTKCPPPRRALRRRRRRRSTTSRRRVLADGGARDDGGARRLRVVLDARCLAPAVTDRPGFAERAARCYAELFAPGARARVAGALVELDGADGAVAADRASGAAAPTRALWAARARVARASPRPKAVVRAVEMCARYARADGGSVAAEEIARALGGGGDGAPMAPSELGQLDATARRWKAAELARALERGAVSRLGALDDEARAALAALAPLRATYPAEAAPPPEAVADGEGATAAVTYGDHGGAPSPLARLRAGRDSSWWSAAKRPQLEWLSATAAALVAARRRRSALDDGGDDTARPPTRVVDVGGGKGDLANLLGARLGAARACVRVVDVHAGALAARRLPPGAPGAPALRPEAYPLPRVRIRVKVGVTVLGSGSQGAGHRVRARGHLVRVTGLVCGVTGCRSQGASQG